MENYNLAPGELVIMQEQSVKLGEGPSGESLDELVLTNQNLILVASASQGLFKRTRMLKRCPLSQIVRHDDVPQAVAAKYRSNYRLQIAFEDEVVSLFFPSNPRRQAERWADALVKAVDGNLSGIDSSAEALPPEITDVVDGAKDLVGAFFGGGKKPQGGQQKGRPASVTTKCVGCHAPITGRAGSTMTCPYCDTRQTL